MDGSLANNYCCVLALYVCSIYHISISGQLENLSLSVRSVLWNALKLTHKWVYIAIIRCIDCVKQTEKYGKLECVTSVRIHAVAFPGKKKFDIQLVLLDFAIVVVPVLTRSHDSGCGQFPFLNTFPFASVLLMFPCKNMNQGYSLRNKKHVFAPSFVSLINHQSSSIWLTGLEYFYSLFWFGFIYFISLYLCINNVINKNMLQQDSVHSLFF